MDKEEAMDIDSTNTPEELTNSDDKLSEEVTDNVEEGEESKDTEEASSKNADVEKDNIDDGFVETELTEPTEKESIEAEVEEALKETDSTEKDNVEAEVEEALKETDSTDKNTVEAEVEKALKETDSTDKDTVAAEVEEALKETDSTSISKKDLLQKIVEDIDLSTDEDETVLEKYVPPDEQSKNKEISKNEDEEETLENIQSHIDSIQPKKASKIMEEVDCTGVFISVNDNDKDNFLTEEESDKLTKDIFGEKPQKSEIPQVILDQLNLEKYPNLSIDLSSPNTKKEVQKTKPKLKPKSVKLKEAEAKESIVERTSRQSKITEVNTIGKKTPKKTTIQKKGTNEKDDEDNEEEEDNVSQRLTRGRGRLPTKQTGYRPILPKPVGSRPPLPKRDANGKFLKNQSKKKIQKEISSESEEDDSEEDGGKPKKKLLKMDLSAKKKTPVTPKATKSKRDTDTGGSQTGTEDDDEGDSTLRSSRRKIKVTSKYKEFVTQEKSINTLLRTLEDDSDSNDNEPTAKSKATPKSKPNPKVNTPKINTPKVNTPKVNLSKVNTPKTATKSILKTVLTNSSKQKKVDETDDVELEQETQTTPLKSILKNSNKRQTRQSGQTRKKLLLDNDSDDDIYTVEYDEDKDPDYDSDHASTASESGISEVEFETSVEISKSGRTVFEMMADVFKLMPNWNLHILPYTNTFCMAQIGRSTTGVPVLKKAIEMDANFNTKVFIQQIHVKKFDGIYDTEDEMIQLIQMIDIM